MILNDESFVARECQWVVDVYGWFMNTNAMGGSELNCQ